jgi:hypothetical protein
MWINAFMWEPMRYSQAQAQAIADALDVASDHPSLIRTAEAVGWFVAERETEKDRDRRSEIADELDEIARALRRGDCPPPTSLAARNVCAEYLQTADEIIAFRRLHVDQDARRWGIRHLPQIIEKLRAKGRPISGADRSLAVKLVQIWKAARPEAPRFAYDWKSNSRTGAFKTFIDAALSPLPDRPALSAHVVSMSREIEKAENAGS